MFQGVQIRLLTQKQTRANYFAMAYVTFGIFYVPLLESKIYMNKREAKLQKKKLTSFCR